MYNKSLALKVACVLIAAGICFAIAGNVMHGTFQSVFIDRNGINTIKGDGKIMSNELENFKNIDVSVCSGRIELIRSNKSAVEYNLNNSEKVSTCEVIGDTFTFKTKPRFTISFFNFEDTYVKIYFKDDNELKNIHLGTISGSIRANDFSAENVTIKSTSGSQSLSDIKANKIELNGTSGSVKIENIGADKINIHSNSGSVTVDKVTCNDIAAKNISGSIKLYNADTKSASVNSSSGSIYIQGSPKGKTIIHNISGSIKVHTSLSKSEYGYKLSSTSGSTKVDNETFKGSVGEDKDNFIDASNSSGSVKVYFNSMGE